MGMALLGTNSFQGGPNAFRSLQSLQCTERKRVVPFGKLDALVIVGGKWIMEEPLHVPAERTKEQYLAKGRKQQIGPAHDFRDLYGVDVGDCC